MHYRHTVHELARSSRFAASSGISVALKSSRTLFKETGDDAGIQEHDDGSRTPADHSDGLRLRRVLTTIASRWGPVMTGPMIPVD
jgi:hypothetical protein